MEIQTKYNIEDELYFFTEKMIVKGVIRRIHIEIDKNIETKYRIDFTKEDIERLKLSSGCAWTSEDFLFRSKEEFINSI